MRAALARRGDAEALALLDEVASLDGEWRASQARADDLRAQLNTHSKTFGMLRGRAGRGDLSVDDILTAPGIVQLMEGLELDDARTGAVTEFLIDQLQIRLREFSEQVDVAAKRTSDVDEQITQRLSYLPNLPEDSVPDGASEEDNVVTRQWGEIPGYDFEPQAHWDLGPALGIIDFERGARIAGSRFYVLTGSGAKLQRSLIQWMLDVHTREHGYREVYPPFVSTEQTLFASGQLPKFRENVYRDEDDDVWLVPTAEVPLTSMHRGEILEPGMLPINYVAYTPSFRREQMSAGRDIRGIKRGHQFDKVEIYKFTEPEQLIGTTGGPAWPRGVDSAASQPDVPHRGVVRGGFGAGGGEDLRHRGVGAGVRGVAGGLKLLNDVRLPGPPRQHPLPTGGGSASAIRAYPQRLRPRAAPRHDRRHGNIPTRRRHHRGA